MDFSIFESGQNHFSRMANCVDPDEIAYYEPAHYELSHQDLQRLQRNFVCRAERVKFSEDLYPINVRMC